MIDFKPPRYQVVLTRRHEPVPMRERAFEVGGIMKGYINGEVQVGNLPPGAPPPMPRFQITDGKRTLVVSDIFAQLVLAFDTGLPTGKSVSELLPNPISYMDKLDRLYDPVAKHFRALVVHAMWPYAGSQEEVAQLIAQSLFSEQSNRDEISASYSLGRQLGAITTNLEINQYNFYQIDVEAVPGQSVGIDADFVNPTEHGLQVKIEVNTKRSMVNNGGGDFSALVSHLKDLAGGEALKKLGVELRI